MTPSMRRGRQLAIAAGVLLALAIPLAAFAATRGGAASAAPPSFTRDVAPVIQQKCAGCHRVGGIAPFPLETSRQIASRSALIAATVQAGLMPPWPPGPRSPAYAGEQERRLSDRERATLVAWAKAGGRVDGPARKPLPEKPPQVESGESLLTLRMPSAYKPRAPKGVTDDYRCFLLDPKRAGDSFVTSARIEPGADKVVHHVILFRVAKAQVADAKGLDLARGPRVELLRRNRASSRLRLRRDPGLAERCELGRRVGAGLGWQPPPRRHWRTAAGRKPNRHAGPLQPAERARPDRRARC